jgi:hypothetical protein
MPLSSIKNVKELSLFLTTATLYHLLVREGDYIKFYHPHSTPLQNIQNGGLSVTTTMRR